MNTFANDKVIVEAVEKSYKIIMDPKYKAQLRDANCIRQDKELAAQERELQRKEKQEKEIAKK